MVSETAAAEGSRAILQLKCGGMWVYLINLISFGDWGGRGSWSGW